MFVVVAGLAIILGALVTYLVIVVTRNERRRLQGAFVAVAALKVLAFVIWVLARWTG